MLADWFDNGRIDRLYPLNCYEEAIDAIPDDLRDYADAEDVITRALQAALRGDLAPGGADPTPNDDDPTGLERRLRRERLATTARAGDSGDNPQAAPGRRHVGAVLDPDSRCSCWEECRSRCSPQAGSATSRGAGTRRTPTTPDEFDPLA